MEGRENGGTVGCVGYGEHQEILPTCQEEQQYSLQKALWFSHG